MLILCLYILYALFHVYVHMSITTDGKGERTQKKVNSLAAGLRYIRTSISA